MISQNFHKIGILHRRAYNRVRITFNVVWQLVYLAFLATGISWAYRKAGKSGRFWAGLNRVPLGGVVLNYLENAAAAVVMARYPDLTPILPSLAGIFTALKWLFIGSSFVLLLVGLGMAGWRWVRSKA